MKRRRTRRSESGHSPRNAASYCSVDVYTGQSNDIASITQREEPQELNTAFELARNWQRKHWFVEQIVKLKLDFFNFGLSFCHHSPPAERALLEKWLDAEDGIHREHLTNYIEDVWREWLNLDNVVSFWRDEGETPIVLPPEQCRFDDTFGNAKLKIHLNLRPEQTKDLPPRYQQSEIEVSEKFGEHFRVLRRGRIGYGRAWPRLFTCVRVLSQAESMEVGESGLAHLGRMPIRQHSIGHEIRQGPKAGQGTWFINKKRTDAIKKELLGKLGPAEVCLNFDHKITYVWPDATAYDGRKWESIMTRLLVWAGPVGYMLMAKALNPFLLNMLKTEAASERARVALHLQPVLNDVFNAPAPIRVSWSDQCFQDLRLAQDMVKFLAELGPLSLKTAMQFVGFDALAERENKAEELEAKPELLMPIWDKNHGQKPQRAGGRPPGTPDPPVT